MYTIMRLFSIIFFVTFVLSSCNKDPYQNGIPELPPITMEGKNTLGFLLDGKVWVPYQENPGIFTPTLEVTMDNNNIIIEARLNNEKLKIEEKLAILFTCSQEGIYNSNALQSILFQINLEIVEILMLTIKMTLSLTFIILIQQKELSLENL